MCIETIFFKGVSWIFLVANEFLHKEGGTMESFGNTFVILLVYTNLLKFPVFAENFLFIQGYHQFIFWQLVIEVLLMVYEANLKAVQFWSEKINNQFICFDVRAPQWASYQILFSCRRNQNEIIIFRNITAFEHWKHEINSTFLAMDTEGSIQYIKFEILTFKSFILLKNWRCLEIVKSSCKIFSILVLSISNGGSLPWCFTCGWTFNLFITVVLV